jgi:hypothetical protein
MNSPYFYFKNCPYIINDEPEDNPYPASFLRTFFDPFPDTEPCPGIHHSLSIGAIEPV